MIFIAVYVVLIIIYSERQSAESLISGISKPSKISDDDTIANSQEPPNINSTLTSDETNHKHLNSTDLSYSYIVQLELKSTRVDESFHEIEKRLDKLVDMAFILAAYKHRKQRPPSDILTDNSAYRTKIMKKRTTGEQTYIYFVTYARNEPILGEVVAEDITLLSASQISATLQYPLGKIISDRDIENESSTKWWFLIGVIGAGIFIILIGWFCLFLFFNTCGYMHGTDEKDYMTRALRASTKGQLVDNPPSMHCKSAAEQPNDTFPSGDSNPSGSTKKSQLNKTNDSACHQHKKPGPARSPPSVKSFSFVFTQKASQLGQEQMQRSCRTLSEIHLERRTEDNRDNIRKATHNLFNKETEQHKIAVQEPFPSSFGLETVDSENTDVPTAQREAIEKSETKGRRTKIGPITTSTTTTARNEQKRNATEISGVHSVRATSAHESDEFDVFNLPETTLKIDKSAKKNKKEQVDEGVKSEPESDYGSSLDDDKSKDSEEKVSEVHGEVIERPMTAKTQRTSLFGGNLIFPPPAQPRAWTVYQAGDRVADFWNNSRMNSHPTPSLPTGNGIIEIKSTRGFNYD